LEPGSALMSDPALERAASLADPLRRKLVVAARLEEELRKRGHRSVVVGGTAVEWYTLGLYRSADIDVLGPWAAIDEVLLDLGFQREGRHWYRSDLGVAIEAPAEGLEPYRDRTSVVELEGVRVTLVSVEEAILDRLRACAHWRSALDCEQALHMMMVHGSQLDWPYLEARAVRDQVVPQLVETKKRAEAMSGTA
jgi:predicted nucleotidyltransferase